MNTSGFCLVLSLLVAAPTGCAAVLKALPTIIQYVQDAQMILDTIDRTVTPVINARGDEKLAGDYNEALEIARASLQVALRSAKGTEELDQKHVDKAFEDFKVAYGNLLEVLKRSGMMSSAGALKAASPGDPVLMVPEPLAISIER